MHYALEKGINFIDVSPYYGETKAETMLGKALKNAPIPRSKYYIATKVRNLKRGCCGINFLRLVDTELITLISQPNE